jgi:hypothetical protein
MHATLIVDGQRLNDWLLTLPTGPLTPAQMILRGRRFSPASGALIRWLDLAPEPLARSRTDSRSRVLIGCYVQPHDDRR